jgi:hypothetical protein
VPGARTPKWLVLEESGHTKPMQMSIISTKDITREEFERWNRHCERGSARKITRRDAAAAAAQIQAALECALAGRGRPAGRGTACFGMDSQRLAAVRRRSHPAPCLPPVHHFLLSQCTPAPATGSHFSPPPSTSSPFDPAPPSPPPLAALPPQLQIHKGGHPAQAGGTPGKGRGGRRHRD